MPPTNLHFFPPPPQCKLAWEGNEGEYDDFYDYAADEVGGGAEAAMVVDGGATHPPALAEYELALPSGALLGSRHLARYYKQAHRVREAGRGAALRGALVARYAERGRRGGVGAGRLARPPTPSHAPVIPSYTALGVLATQSDPVRIAARREAQKARVRAEKVDMRAALRGNVNRNLPRNVPY